MSAATEFLVVLRAHYGIYLDAAWGFGMVKEKIEEIQTLSLSSRPHVTIEELNEENLVISEKDPAEYRAEHVAKMGSFKQRNAVGGLNHVVLGNLVVVSIFSFWDVHYRAKIAKELGMSTENELCVPVMGDIRLMRNDIVRHGGMATKRNCGKCEKLCGFKAGDRIIIDEGKLDMMVMEVRAAIKSLPSPRHVL